MRTTFALALVCALSQTASAETIFTPTLPSAAVPEEWIGLIFDIQPAPEMFLADLPGSRTATETIVGNSLWMPRIAIEGVAAGTLFTYLKAGQANPLTLFFLQEANNQTISQYNVALRTPDGQPLVRNVTVTAPGYSRSFQAAFVPEPGSALLIALCLPFSWRKRCR